jgi:hypothetical protein
MHHRGNQLIWHVFSRTMQVALKALVVIHRLLRDGDPTFREELLNFTQRVQILQLSNFKDNSSPIGQYFWFSICNMTACLVQVNSVPLLCILIFFLYFFISSLGLFFMGSHIWFIFGGKTTMLQDTEV